MKVFILLAIIFFSWRVFSADEHFYEGRYYKIDEYVRFHDDPNYQQYLTDKRIEAKESRAGIEDYFGDKEKEQKKQELSRQRHVEWLAQQPTDNDLLKAEAEHEKEKECQAKIQERLRSEYLAKKDYALKKSNPKRMIASVFETPEDKPMKRIPRENRKFRFKPKSPSSRK